MSAHAPGSAPPSLPSVLIWDLPTRLLHWALVASFAGALGLATLAHDGSPAFVLHMLLGLVAAAVVALRLAWGLVGSRWARLGSFLHGPAALLGYLRAALAGRDERYAGHNPGASWAIYGLLLLPLTLAATGLFMRQGGELFEDLHDALAWLMAGAAVAHLAGLAWHTFRHREAIALGMITGLKRAAPDQAIPSAHPAAGALVALLLVGWGAVLLTGHEPEARRIRLPLGGLSLPVGPKGGAPHGDGGGHREAERDDD